MHNYLEKKEIVEYLLRMDKSYSSFFYFTLEANEGVAFFSTMPFEKGQQFRDILVRTTPELEKELINIISHCSKKAEIEILSNQTLSD
jgi:hypothetical protein